MPLAPSGIYGSLQLCHASNRIFNLFRSRPFVYIASAMVATSLLACGGGNTNAVTASTPVTPAAGSVNLVPVSISFLGTGGGAARTFSVSQTNYSGAFTVSTAAQGQPTSCSGIAIVSPTSAVAPGPFTVTPTGYGNCAFTVTGGGNQPVSLEIMVTNPASQTLPTKYLSGVYLYAGTTNEFVDLRTTLTVPAPPPATGTLFLWPGLDPAPGGRNFLPIDNGVLQPVLTWGASCAPGQQPIQYSTWWISGQVREHVWICIRVHRV